MRFGDVQAKRKPVQVVHMPPSAFAGTADADVRPSKIGLVTISQHAIDRARSTAANCAWVAHPNIHDVKQREETFHQLYACALLAAAVTSADDASRPPDEWAAAPEDVMRMALTDAGIRWLLGQLEEAHIAASPLSEEADAGDLSSLQSVVSAALPLAPAHVQARVRRMLRHSLDLMRPYMPMD